MYTPDVYNKLYILYVYNKLYILFFYWYSSMTIQSLQNINKLFKNLNIIKTHIKHKIKLSLKKNKLKKSR